MAGLIPVKKGSNSPYAASVNMYYVSSSETNALYVGDVVARSGGADAGGQYGGVVRGTLTANNPWLGVVVGVLPVVEQTKGADPLEVPWGAGSTVRYVLVSDDPDQEYLVQEDADSSTVAAADVGNLGLLIGAAGGNIYGFANVKADSSSFGSTGTSNGQVLLLGIVDRPDNVLGQSGGALLRVKINPAQKQA